MITMSGSGQKKSRAKGEGTYEKLPSGKYRYIVKKNHQTLKGPAEKSKTLAKEAWKTKFANPVAKNQPSLSTSAKTWAEIKKAESKSPATKEQIDLFIKNKVEEDPIGALRPADINDEDVLGWQLRQKGASSTKRRNFSRLKALLAYVGVQTKVSRPPDTGHARRPLSPKERDDISILMAQADEPTRRAIIIAFGTGLSRSEICALKHEDRDGDGLWIRRRAIQTKGRLDVEPETKTARRRAWILIPKHVRDIVGPPASGFALTDSKDPITPHALTKRLRKAMIGTQIEKVPYAGLHTLRRTYGMILLEKGVEVVTAAELMRHDPTMLLKEYTRSRMDLKTAAINMVFGDDSESERTHPGTHEAAV